MEFLDAVLASESEDVREIEFHVICKTHLDKLMSEITSLPQSRPSVSSKLSAAISVARKIQASWRERFKDDYIEIDRIRSEHMTTTGRLKDISFVNSFETGTGSGV
jgi:hypothetical protein